MPPTFEEQAASLITSTFKDGEASDGAPTAEEEAAAAANRSGEAKKADAVGKVQEEAEGAEEDQEEAEGAEESEDAGEGDAADAAEPKVGEPKPAKGAKKSAADRIGDLTAARRSAERAADTERTRADRLQAELDALKNGKAPLTAAQSDGNSGEASPDPSQFDYGELDPKYIAALARYETRQAHAAEKAKDDEVRQTQAAAEKQREQGQKQDALVKAGVKLHDDFDEVVMQGAREGKWALTATMGELILDSEFGPQIAYDLASDPDEAERIAKLSPAQQAAHVGRLEAKFEAVKSSQGGKTSKTPQAPPPPKTPRGGSGSSKIGADSPDFAAVEAAWRSGGLR